MKTTHTPLPWVVRNEDTVSSIESARRVADCEYTTRSARPAPATEQDKANAAFIARACNSHYDLLAALEAMLAMTDRGPKPSKLDAALTWRENDDLAKYMAVSAIAKAKGEA